MDEEHTPFLTNHEKIENIMNCNHRVTNLYQEMFDIIYHMKYQHELVRRTNRVDYNTLFSKNVVCTEKITKLSDYFFITINGLLYSILNVVKYVLLVMCSANVQIYTYIL